MKTIKDRTEELQRELYPTIGKFAVSFERVCYALKMGISELMEVEGLSNDRITDILIGDLTLFPLQSIFRALIAETGKITPDNQYIIDNIFKRIVKLGEERNKIIHSAWFIDYKNRKALRAKMLTGHKPGYNKKGAKPSWFNYPISEIKKMIKEANVLSDLVHQLGICIYTNHGIEPCFKLYKNRNVRLKGSRVNYFIKFEKVGISHKK